MTLLGKNANTSLKVRGNGMRLILSNDEIILNIFISPWTVFQ